MVASDAQGKPGTVALPTIGLFLAQGVGLPRGEHPSEGIVGWLERAARRRVPAEMHRAPVRGSQVAVKYLLRAFLRSRSARLEVFVPPQNARPPSRSELRQHGATAESFGLHSAFELLEGIDRFNFTAWLDLTGDIAHALRVRSIGPARLYPVVAVAHGLSAHQLLFNWFLRVLCSGVLPCDSFACTSRAARVTVHRIFDQVASRFNRQFGTRLSYSGRTDLIPLCVDTDELRPRDKLLARAKVGLPKDAFVILFIGHLSLPDKADLFPLLRVLAQLAEEFPKRNLILVAAGTERGHYAEALKRYARALGVSKQIRTMLDISDETRNLLLSAADLLASPADGLAEAFGLTPVEAMASGLPQVVADWDGYRDTVVDGETGFLVPTRWTPCTADLNETGPLLGWTFDHFAAAQSVAVDLGALADRLRHLIQNEGLRQRMSEASRKRALAYYSPEIVTRRYCELWAELSGIARALPNAPPREGFDRPHYWECFGHYASIPLGRATTVGLTDQGREALRLEGALLPPHSDYVNLPVLDEGLLRDVLAEVGGRFPSEGAVDDANSEPVSIADLANKLANGRTADCVVRHVMWLIKYGLVETAQECGMGETDS